MLWLWVMGIVLVLIILRKLLRRRPKAVTKREIRQEDRQRRRNAHMQRRFKTRGIVVGNVKMCSCGCGNTKGYCQEMTARAEHPEGMLGPRKKK